MKTIDLATIKQIVAVPGGIDEWDVPRLTEARLDPMRRHLAGAGFADPEWDKQRDRPKPSRKSHPKNVRRRDADWDGWDDKDDGEDES